MVPGAPLPARPVCGAVRSHNGQLGFMLVKILDAVSDIWNIQMQLKQLPL